MRFENDVTGNADALRSMPLPDLKKEWCRHFRSAPPPGLSRDLMIRGISFKLQEQLHGGLSQSNKRKLQTLSKLLEEGKKGPPTLPTLKPGTTLVRDWQGRRHMVTVNENCFTYAGEQFQSLSVIARNITGTRWSGPRFFGLRGLADQADEEVPNDA